MRWGLVALSWSHFVCQHPRGPFQGTNEAFLGSCRQQCNLRQCKSLRFLLRKSDFRCLHLGESVWGWDWEVGFSSTVRAALRYITGKGRACACVGAGEGEVAEFLPLPYAGIAADSLSPSCQCSSEGGRINVSKCWRSQRLTAIWPGLNQPKKSVFIILYNFKQ